MTAVNFRSCPPEQSVIGLISCFCFPRTKLPLGKRTWSSFQLPCSFLMAQQDVVKLPRSFYLDRTASLLTAQWLRGVLFGTGMCPCHCLRLQASWKVLNLVSLSLSNQFSTVTAVHPKSIVLRHSPSGLIYGSLPLNSYPATRRKINYVNDGN